MIRRLLTLVALVAALAGGAVALGASPAQADTPSVSRSDAIKKVQEVRESIDRTLALIKEGQADQAFDEAKDGYLNHFELVEIPLRVVDTDLDLRRRDAVRRDPRADPRRRVRSSEIRDEDRRAARPHRRRRAPAHRRPGSARPRSCRPVVPHHLPRGLRGRAPAVACCSATSRRRRRRSTCGRSSWAWRLAAVATVAHGLPPAARSSPRCRSAARCSRPSPRSSRWRCSSTCRSGSSRGSSRSAGWSSCRPGCGAPCRSARRASLVLVGFTAVYREGFETALFYQALLSFGPGLGVWVLAGLCPRPRSRCGRRLADLPARSAAPDQGVPVVAVVLVMATSVAFLGNAVHALQAPTCAVHAARRLAATADLPVPGDRLLADGADRHRPAGAHRRLPARARSTCSS